MIWYFYTIMFIFVVKICSVCYIYFTSLCDTVSVYWCQPIDQRIYGNWLTSKNNSCLILHKIWQYMRVMPVLLHLLPKIFPRLSKSFNPDNRLHWMLGNNNMILSCYSCLSDWVLKKTLVTLIFRVLRLFWCHEVL